MSATTIRQVTAVPLDLMLNEPFGIAGGAQDVARNVLVMIELADRTRGYGEAAPFPVFNGETQEAALTAVQDAAPALIGSDVRQWRSLAAMLHTVPSMIGSARCALETAMLDAFTRHARQPLWAFFGGATTYLTTDMTVTTGTVEQAVLATQKIVNRGIRTIKIKVGGAATNHDFERVRAIADHANGARLFLDGNGGMQAHAALELLQALRELGVELALLEQPVPRSDHAGMVRLATNAGVPVAADESLTNAADALQLWRTGAAHVLNIKLMKSGIVEALDIAAIARAAGMGLMIGGMVESILAMTVSACFAAGLGGFQFVDLDTPLFLAENPFRGGMLYRGELIQLAQITAGHGVVPRA